MGTGTTNYTATPWGLLTQQQLVLFMLFNWQQYNTANLLPADVAANLAQIMTWYNTAWPAVEAVTL